MGLKMAEVTIDTKAANQAIMKVQPVVMQEIRRIFSAEAAEMAGYIKSEYMTGGTTASKLKVRTGKLRASVRSLKNRVVGTTISGGVGIGTVYGRVHIGPSGQETVIKPKQKKYLTIPLPAALTKAGVTKGSAMSGVWGETFVAKTKKGNLIIFGQYLFQKGKKAGQAAGKLVPLFLLRKEVTVPARIHPEDIIEWEKPKMVQALLKMNINVKE